MIRKLRTWIWSFLLLIWTTVIAVSLVVLFTAYYGLLLAFILLLLAETIVFTLLWYKNDQVSRLKVQDSPEREDTLEVRRINTSLAIAEKIQKQLLPRHIPDIPGLDAYAKSRPSDEIGGDFYQILPLPKATLFAIGDVAGHGLPSGMISIMLDTLLHAFGPNLSPKDLLTEMNRILYRRIDPSLFSTLLLLYWDHEHKRLIFSSAGHGYLLHYNSEKNVLSARKSGGIALGMIPDIANHVREEGVVFLPGDTLVVCTDGITEMRNAQGESLGNQKFRDIAAKRAPLHSARRVFDEISQDILSFAGTAKQMDDLTLMVLKRL